MRRSCLFTRYMKLPNYKKVFQYNFDIYYHRCSTQETCICGKFPIQSVVVIGYNGHNSEQQQSYPWKITEFPY